MTENYYAGVYWPSRKESPEACARRAASLFQGISTLDPTWANWFGTGKSRKQALEKRLPPIASTFEQLFSLRKHQLVSGFSFVAWNGEADGSTTGVTCTCGVASPYLSNVCTVNPPRRGPIAERLIDATVMSRTLQAMALAWEPEWGVATSDLHRDEVLKTATPGTFVGWVMYFSHSWGTVPPLPAPVRIEPVADKGTLIILTPERFTASNPEHVALAAQVQELLDRAGLLRPLQA
ncbi:immunity 52 family protein [Pyxidicoccus xibeiensis]|uniref:immunity 52 family protein n=1 Tax=Pyxidicoccus xibeiensis TaxID=2906759 RepID=UPI0020A7B8D2|nr:Imm52 family immunity protein [Pyxidicoccus xibeiensis]MCP3142839.1 immunity 52 family protein [Pyxidicoccus xibeiensis]